MPATACTGRSEPPRKSQIFAAFHTVLTSQSKMARLYPVQAGHFLNFITSVRNSGPIAKADKEAAAQNRDKR
jgi:hypothetical protein